MKVPRHHRGLALSGRRARAGLAVAASLVVVFGLVGPANATPPPAAEPDPVSLTEADLTQLAAGTPATVPLTLLTGDTVQVSLDEAGNPTVQQVTAAPRPGGAPVAFHTLTRHGDTFVVPDDALPLLASDLLDWNLFNLRELAELAANGTVGATPVLVTHPGQAVAAQSVPMVGATGGQDLPSIDATALTINGGSWWPALTRTGAEPATLAAGPLAGVEKIWLDGLAEVTLDESVPQIGAPVAWARGLDGTGVTVAVLDTGVDATHPDLAGKVVEAVDFTGTAPGAVDGHGHGTHVAATIAGTGAGSDGLRKGVAPGANVLIGKVCGDNGTCPGSAIIAGMEWAAESGAPVVSMSLGGEPTDGTDPLSQAVNNLSAQHGTLFVIAAGNAGPSLMTVGAPGAADAALTVAAVDKQDKIAEFSSRGPRKGDLAPKPDIAAPGVGIVAARAAGTAMGSPVDELYTAASGTSMATPHVSGAAALLAQQRPDLTGEQLKALLMSTSVDLGRPQWEQGSGRVEVPRAIDPSVFVAGSGAFGRRPFPHQPVTRNLTYHNVTEAPVSLTLSGSLTGPDGAPVPAGMFTLSQTEITIPAGGSTVVSAVLDGGLLGEDGPFGEYRGSIDAVDSGGELRSRTLVSGFLEPERFPVTVEVVPPAGADDLVADSWLAIPVDDQTDLHTTRLLAFGTQIDLFPGTYAFGSQAITWRDQDGWLNQATVTAPEVTVTDQPVTVRLDLRQLEPVRVTTPERTEVYSSAMHWQRYSVNQDWSLGMNMRTGDEPVRWWTLPAGPVELGEFSFTSSHTLIPPMVDMLTVGQGAARIHPRYPSADVTVAAGTYSWTDGDTQVVRRVRMPVPKLANRGPTRIVNAGAGLPADLAGARLDGAIALIRPVDICPVGEACDFPALRDRVAGAADLGAVAVLVAGEQGWVGIEPTWTNVECPDGPDSCPPVEPFAPIPMLLISSDEADDLTARLDRGTVRALSRSRDELPRVYLLSFHSPDRVPSGLPYQVGYRDLDRVAHRFHADQPGQVTSINWLRMQESATALRMPLPLVATQRTLTALVQHDPNTLHFQEVQTAPYLRPNLLDVADADTYENHAYVVDGGRSTDLVSWNLGPIVPGTGVAPTTQSGFQSGGVYPCPGCREGDVLYPGMFLATADGHMGQYVGVANDTGLTRRLIGITPCEPPECQIRLYDEAGNELEQKLIRIGFVVGDAGPATAEEVNR